MGTISISAAKRELYEKLKDDEEILGAGIKGNGDSEYIVIFVKNLSAKIKVLIPATYKGIRVKPEKRSTAKIM